MCLLSTSLQGSVTVRVKHPFLVLQISFHRMRTKPREHTMMAVVYSCVILVISFWVFGCSFMSLYLCTIFYSLTSFFLFLQICMYYSCHKVTHKKREVGHLVFNKNQFAVQSIATMWLFKVDYCGDAFSPYQPCVTYLFIFLQERNKESGYMWVFEKDCYQKPNIRFWLSFLSYSTTSSKIEHLNFTFCFR